MTPWEKWTPEQLRDAAFKAYLREVFEASAMLEAFADLLQAERDGKRCVLPKEIADQWLMTCKPHNWCAEVGELPEIGQGKTQQSAIEDLAAKLRGEG